MVFLENMSDKQTRGIHSERQCIKCTQVKQSAEMEVSLKKKIVRKKKRKRKILSCLRRCPLILFQDMVKAEMASAFSRKL